MKVTVPMQIILNIMDFAKANHPLEIILLLRGETNKYIIHISDYLFPPFGSSGRGFVSFPIHMLPIDFTIVGTAHSHPSGSLKPSLEDLNNFYGRIMIIVGPPFQTSSFAAYNKQGERLLVEIQS